MSLESRTAKSIGEFVARSTPILRASGPWCRFGIRDPSFLTDIDGRPIVEDGRLIMFFNGRDKPIPEGGITRVGRASLTADGSRCAMDQGPVLADGDYAAQASAIRVERDLYWMFYSVGTDRGFRRAVSKDGIAWEPEAPVLLSPGQFGCTRIGLPYVAWLQTRWVMVFEGICKNRFRIFSATSPDGRIWTPAFDAAPIYLPPAGNWDGAGQANPSFVEVGEGEDAHVALYYNGHSVGEKSGWDIGIATATLPFPSSATGNMEPLVCRTSDGWMSGRLEGPRVFADCLTGATRMVYFGLPTADSYRDGAIGIAERKSTTMNPSGGEPINDEPRDPALDAEARANDQLAQRYFLTWDHFPIQKYTHAKEAEWMGELVNLGESILLAGSGGGREIEAIIERAGRIAALDTSPEMLRIGRERFASDKIEWRLGDVHAPPADLDDFDHIFALGGVFAYLREPEQAARALANRLRANGTLSICSMNGAHPSERPGRKELRDGRVRQAYELADFIRFLEVAGLKVERKEGFRFLADLLPQEWNRSAQDNPEYSRLIEQALVLEDQLIGRMPPENGKFIWVTGRRSVESA